jgi:DNA-binding transcriptional MerR regulator/effector-binding domain-containing protein
MTETSRHYRIGEFAQLSGVSTKTLRFYDEIGLLHPAGVDPRTRYRHYLPKQLNDLATILSLRDLGVSLAEIRHALGRSESKGDRRRMLEQMRQSVKNSIQDAERTLRSIDAALEELNGPKVSVAVTVKRRPATWIASIRAVVDHYVELSSFEQELRNALPEHSIGSLRGVLWHRCADSGVIEGEPFLELKHNVPRRSIYDVQQLPSATLACGYCEPDDDAAENVYRTLKRWMEVRGYRLAGPKREIDLGNLLEIQFPLQSS